MKTHTSSEVSEFYNDYSVQQKNLGVSVRHRIIYNNLLDLGLNSSSKVLEIGCGIGTVSSLIIKKVKDQGVFVGCDISDESINIANKNYGSKNVSFVCTDMSDFTHNEKFDFIVFPDVLEHIPVEQHKNLFEKVANVCHKGTKVLINIPHPDFLNWIRINEPHLLQIIDQSLSMQDLLNNTYPNGFQLYSIEPYAIHTKENNYFKVILVLDNEVKSKSIKSKLINFIFNFKYKLLTFIR